MKKYKVQDALKEYNIARQVAETIYQNEISIAKQKFDDTMEKALKKFLKIANGKNNLL